MDPGTALDQIQPQGECKVHLRNNSLINTGSVYHTNPTNVVKDRDFVIGEDDSAQQAGHAPTPYPHPLTQIGSHVFGDVHGDGDVNSQDVLACVNHMLSRQNGGTSADMNDDGLLNALHCLSIVLLMSQE